MNSYEEEQRKNEIARLQYIKKSDAIAEVINALPDLNYGADVAFTDIDWQIERYRKNYGSFEENPDFQRGHVWTEKQQIKFIEAIVRGNSNVPRNIILNCPEFHRDKVADDSDLSGFVVVDGLQRLTAMRKFINGEFKIFSDVIEGGVDKDFFDKSRFNLKTSTGFRFVVMNYQYKRDLLNFYIAFNDGGTVHSESEIERVKAMREELILNSGE